MTTPLQALPLETLRERTSSKWRRYPADVLPLHVAETDFALAPAITRALTRAVELGDTGYSAPHSPVARPFVDFANRRFGWDVDPAQVHTTGDVCMGVVEILRAVTKPGERVIVTPPVYPPFYEVIPEAGAVVEAVPLIDNGTGWQLDLDGIRAAFQAGARGILLCNPHNPLGTAFAREELASLAELAAEFEAAVVSDEIHAPIAQPDSGFIPFLMVSDAARSVGYSVTSASKAFNLAGLSCALMVTAADETHRVVRGLPVEVAWRTGHFGAMAATAAFASESDEWLDSLLATLDENRRLVASLLTAHIPQAKYRLPDASYLAWIDLTDLGWGDNPARKILREAKVALHFGPDFGPQGAGHVRLNFGTSPENITEAIARIASLTAR